LLPLEGVVFFPINVVGPTLQNMEKGKHVRLAMTMELERKRSS
jgi:hypothetical protein